jgi:hypothetical protein
MEETWFNGVAKELARCMTDAQACAEACEALLESMREATDDDSRRVIRALVPPTAIARVLVDLVDQPRQLLLAVCRLCHESARSAVDDLEAFGSPVDAARVIPALRASAESCEQLLLAATA